VSESARTWGIRVLALGIAIGIWFSASVEDRLVSSEKVVEASVLYNRPRGFLVLNQVQNVNVRLIGSKKAIRQLNPYMVDVQVDLTQREAGTVTVSLGRENVLAPDGLEVVSIEPRTLRLVLEREDSQRMTVIPELTGKPAPGVFFEEPEVFPNQVLVTGPASLLAQFKSVTTQPVRLDGRTTTFEETVAVVPPDPMIQIVQPAQVSVRLPVQQPEAPDAGEGGPQEQREEP
jgi:YbbR domain-containing protein